MTLLVISLGFIVNFLYLHYVNMTIICAKLALTEEVKLKEFISMQKLNFTIIFSIFFSFIINLVLTHYLLLWYKNISFIPNNVNIFLQSEQRIFFLSVLILGLSSLLSFFLAKSKLNKLSK